MTKLDLLDWRQHPVTKQVFAAFKEREGQLLLSLGASVGLDPQEDRFRAGYLSALRDFYQVDLEDTQE